MLVQDFVSNLRQIGYTYLWRGFSAVSVPEDPRAPCTNPILEREPSVNCGIKPKGEIFYLYGDLSLDVFIHYTSAIYALPMSVNKEGAERSPGTLFLRSAGKNVGLHQMFFSIA